MRNCARKQRKPICHQTFTRKKGDLSSVFSGKKPCKLQWNGGGERTGRKSAVGEVWVKLWHTWVSELHKITWRCFDAGLNKALNSFTGNKVFPRAVSYCNSQIVFEWMHIQIEWNYSDQVRLSNVPYPPMKKSHLYKTHPYFWPRNQYYFNIPMYTQHYFCSRFTVKKNWETQKHLLISWKILQNPSPTLFLNCSNLLGGPKVWIWRFKASITLFCVKSFEGILILLILCHKPVVDALVLSKFSTYTCIRCTTILWRHNFWVKKVCLIHEWIGITDKASHWFQPGWDIISHQDLQRWVKVNRVGEPQASLKV